MMVQWGKHFFFQSKEHSFIFSQKIKHLTLVPSTERETTVNHLLKGLATYTKVVKFVPNVTQEDPSNFHGLFFLTLQTF